MAGCDAASLTRMNYDWLTVLFLEWCVIEPVFVRFKSISALDVCITTLNGCSRLLSFVVAALVASFVGSSDQDVVTSRLATLIDP